MKTDPFEEVRIFCHQRGVPTGSLEEVRIFCHKRGVPNDPLEESYVILPPMGVTGGYRWLRVVTGDSRFKVKSSIRDKHTNILTPRWHYIYIYI